MRSITALEDVSLDEIAGNYARSENRTFRISENVQAYLLQNGGLYLTQMEGLDTGKYRLRGWYDTFSGSAGKAIRIIIATPRD